MRVELENREHKKPGEDESLTVHVMLGPKTVATLIIVGDQIRPEHIGRLRAVLSQIKGLLGEDELTPRSSSCDFFNENHVTRSAYDVPISCSRPQGVSP